MKMKPCKNAIPIAAMFEPCLKMRRGMIGYLANFPSTPRKITNVTTPKMIRQMTVAESQGNATPPYTRPRRNIIVPPEIVRVPNQSMALSPSRNGVLGVSTCKKKSMNTAEIPAIGTTNSQSLYSDRESKQNPKMTYD